MDRKRGRTGRRVAMQNSPNRPALRALAPLGQVILLFTEQANRQASKILVVLADAGSATLMCGKDHFHYCSPDVVRGLDHWACLVSSKSPGTASE